MLKLDVFFNHELCGQIIKKEGLVSFRYQADWVENNKPILSVSLPLQRDAFSDLISRSFFSNLLPESSIKTWLAKNIGISEQNDIGLLEKIGGECAGAISVFPSGSTPTTSGSYKPLNKANIQHLFGENKNIPLMVKAKEYRLSLAGAQNKIPIYIKNNDFYLPQGPYASTHILKPNHQDFDAISENELFCLTLANQLGIPSIDGKIINLGSSNILCTKRYDRQVEADGYITRLHQEDFCQALSVLPNNKYESEGGPSLEKCAKIIDQWSSDPIADKQSFVRWIIFNILIGNADAHAKNISLLHTGNTIRLAPFYDLVCTLAYPGLSKKLAMKVGKENRFEWIQKRHWETLASQINVSPSFLFDQLNVLSTTIEHHAQEVKLNLKSVVISPPIFDQILAIISKHAGCFRGIR